MYNCDDYVFSSEIFKPKKTNRAINFFFDFLLLKYLVQGNVPLLQNEEA